MSEPTREDLPITTITTADIQGHQYNFETQNQAQTEAVTLLKNLQEGKTKLNELSYSQLHQSAVELMRYQISAAFPDDEEDDWACSAFLETNKTETPIFTEYSDENGEIHKAEVITKEKSKPVINQEDLTKAEELMVTTHKGLIRQTLSDIIQHMADPRYEFGTDAKYSPSIAETYLTTSQIIREEAKNNTPPQEINMPEFLKGTYKFGMDILPLGDIVIGEKHLKWSQNSGYEQLFSQKFEQAQDAVVIVENNMDRKDSVFGKLAVFPTWQEEAISMAKEKKQEVVGLDDGIVLDKPELFKRNGFSPETIINAALLTQIDRVAQTGGNWQDWLNALPENYREQAKIMVNKYYEKAITEQGIEDIRQILRLYPLLDAQCRENYYLQKIKEIKKANPNRKLFIVVGDSHREGITKALLGQEESTVSQSDRDLFLSRMASFTA